MTQESKQNGKPFKTALVTGASSGIGYVFAKELAKQGYLVTGVARNEKKLKDLISQIGKNHRYIVADLADDEQLDRVSKDIISEQYTLLINNAGYGMYDRFETIPYKKHEHLVKLNVNCVMRLSYDYLKNASAGDALINVSSALSRLSFPGGAVYAGSKGFVTLFTESLWYEFKDKGIYIMALLPGMTNTNFHNVALDQTAPERPGAAFGAPPEIVVKEAMRALKNRKLPCLISSPKFRFFANFSFRLFTRKKVIELMGAKSPGLK